MDSQIVWKMGIAVVLMGVLALAGIYDFFCLFSGKPDATVSVVLRNAAHQWPIIPYLAGMLMGHLFWN